jgi:antitoxin (DNA-binding transcriptional repressor) of toxin-antitoxin stability system
MKRVSITEARRRLPQLVRQLKHAPGSAMQITMRNEVVAKLRAARPVPEPEPGAAARALLELAQKLPKRRRRRGRPTDISAHVKEYLYGRRR